MVRLTVFAFLLWVTTVAAVPYLFPMGQLPTECPTGDFCGTCEYQIAEAGICIECDGEPTTLDELFEDYPHCLDVEYPLTDCGFSANDINARVTPCEYPACPPSTSDVCEQCSQQGMIAGTTQCNFVNDTGFGRCEIEFLNLVDLLPPIWHPPTTPFVAKCVGIPDGGDCNGTVCSQSYMEEWSEWENVNGACDSAVCGTCAPHRTRERNCEFCERFNSTEMVECEDVACVGGGNQIQDCGHEVCLYPQTSCSNSTDITGLTCKKIIDFVNRKFYCGFNDPAELLAQGLELVTPPYLF